MGLQDAQQQESPPSPDDWLPSGIEHVNYAATSGCVPAFLTVVCNSALSAIKIRSARSSVTPWYSFRSSLVARHLRLIHAEPFGQSALANTLRDP